MKSLNISILSMAMALTLAGCFDSGSRESLLKGRLMEVNTDASLSDKATRDENEPVQEVGKFTLELVEQALKAQGMKLGSKHRSADWVLNRVQAMMYTISENLQGDSPSERISVYVYRSEEERKIGLSDFKLQAEKYNMQVPNIYEQDNILLLYWHSESLDNASSAKYTQEIRKALGQLSERKMRDISDPIGVMREISLAVNRNYRMSH